MENVIEIYAKAYNFYIKSDYKIASVIDYLSSYDSDTLKNMQSMSNSFRFIDENGANVINNAINIIMIKRKSRTLKK